MKPLSVEHFQQNQQGGQWINRFPDGTNIKTFESSPTGFIQEEKPFNSPYTYRKVVDQRGNVIAMVTEFYAIRIGTSKFYDHQGNLLREENNDNGFDVSIEDLSKIMQENFGIDIMLANNIKSLRRFISPKNEADRALYMIEAFEGAKPGMIDGYIIDGKTGLILLKMSLDSEYPNVSLYNEYLHQNKLK